MYYVEEEWPFFIPHTKDWHEQFDGIRKSNIIRGYEGILSRPYLFGEGSGITPHVEESKQNYVNHSFYHQEIRDRYFRAIQLKLQNKKEDLEGKYSSINLNNYVVGIEYKDQIVPLLRFNFDDIDNFFKALRRSYGYNHFRKIPSYTLRVLKGKPLFIKNDDYKYLTYLKDSWGMNNPEVIKELEDMHSTLIKIFKLNSIDKVLKGFKIITYHPLRD